MNKVKGYLTILNVSGNNETQLLLIIKSTSGPGTATGASRVTGTNHVHTYKYIYYNLFPK